jgi:hypothetical protein
MAGANWHDLPDELLHAIFKNAGIKMVGRISLCSKQLRTTCNSHLNLLVVPAKIKILKSRPTIYPASYRTGHTMQAALWNDELCEAYALAHHRFPCITEFSLVRGLITEAGLAALASAIMQDTKRREAVFSSAQEHDDRPLWLRPWHGHVWSPGCELNLTNNNVATLEAPLGKLLFLETTEPWTITLTDNKLKASEANYDALQEIYEARELERNERARSRPGDRSKYGSFSINGTPLGKALSLNNEKKHLLHALNS